jgi:twitching motility two-component system response regulator PilG
MADVLIVDDDLGLQEILRVGLHKYRDSFAVFFASNGEEAKEILAGRSIDLVVTDIKMPKVDGLELLSHLSAQYPSMPCIVLTSYIIPGLERQLSRSVLKFHKKPVQIEKLADSILEGLELSERDDSLTGVSVTGLAQIVEAEQKSCRLVLRRHGRELGSLFFEQGELIDAEYGDLSGEEAAIQLVGLDDVQIEFRAPSSEKRARKIQAGLQGLLLEAMRIKDEAEAQGQGGDADDRVTELLAEGIRQAEGLHLKKAQKLLFEVLKDKPESTEGWLWLSRTLNSKKKLKIALTRMYKLAPTDKNVDGEIRKFHIASARCGEKINRCPLCYAPLDPRDTKCHFCRSYLAVNDEVLTKIGKDANQDELERTLERFEQVLSRELNIPVLFYAGLACLNKNDFAEALQYFEQVLECVGDGKNVYTKTVQKIVNFIASRQDGEIGHQDQEASPLPVIEREDGRKRILVVEDSPTTRKVIKMTLDTNGYHVIEAGDGVEALSRLNDDRPDLILLDVMLPSLDGYGILSLLKKNSEFKKVPVIMLTSKDSFKDKLRGRFSSASAYLTKPFKPEVLLQQVSKYLDKK